MSRYCTNCGAEMPEDARFCGSCGKPAHQTAAVATPEADVPVPPPPRQNFWDGEPRPARGGALGKLALLLVALAIGLPILLTVLWYVMQFIVGFWQGFMGAL